MTSNNQPFIFPSPSTQSAADTEYLRRLQSIADRWRATGVQPREAGPLSGGEYRAVSLAARHPVPDPVGDFLILDGWLQRWVLEQLEMTRFVGQRVGID
jgi:ABC-type cobalamin transport system ATPase subunit